MSNEILQGNAKIAEFMGNTIMFRDGSVPIVCFNNNITQPIESWARYHSSWDWLKSVIDRMFELWKPAEQNTPQYAINIRLLRFQKECPINSSIEQVYLKVQLFIDWYTLNVTPS